MKYIKSQKIEVTLKSLVLNRFFGADQILSILPVLSMKGIAIGLHLDYLNSGSESSLRSRAKLGIPAAQEIISGKQWAEKMRVFDENCRVISSISNGGAFHARSIASASTALLLSKGEKEGYAYRFPRGAFNLGKITGDLSRGMVARDEIIGGGNEVFLLYRQIWSDKEYLMSVPSLFKKDSVSKEASA